MYNNVLNRISRIGVNSFEPKFQTDWIELDTDDIYNSHLYIHGKSDNKSINDLLKVIEHSMILISQSYQKFNRNYQFLGTLKYYNERRPKLYIPYSSKIHELDNYSGKLEIKLVCQFNIQEVKHYQGGNIVGLNNIILVDEITFKILRIDINDMYEQPVDDVNDLDLVVTI